MFGFGKKRKALEHENAWLRATLDTYRRTLYSLDKEIVERCGIVITGEMMGEDWYDVDFVQTDLIERAKSSGLKIPKI